MVTKKITSTKCRIMDVKVSKISEPATFVRHLRHIMHDMIQCRSHVGVDEELNYSQRVVDDKLACEDTNALEYEKAIDQSIDGITSNKRDDAISIHLDLVIGQLDKLFKIAPTPVPDLPKREEDEVVDVIEQLITQLVFENFQEAKLGYMEQLTQAGEIVTEQEAEAAVLESGIDLIPSPEEILDIAKKMKSKALNFMFKRATTGAKKMEKEIHDILVETDFGCEFIEFIHDFNTYPYAVMRVGSHIPVARKIWKGNKWKFEDQLLPNAKRISPHHFYWSSDSLEVDDGVAVGDVVYLKRSDLERLYNLENDGQIKDNIKECVTMCNSFKNYRNWLDGLGHDKENVYDDKSAWGPTATVPVFRLHTLLDTCNLKEFGIEIKGKEKLSQYECEAWVLNNKIVRFKLMDPKGYKRPYVVEKFRHLPGKFHGKSLPQILKPLEYQIRSIKRNEILNIGFSSAPVVQIDSRAFNEDDLPKVINPGDNLFVEGYPGKNIKPIEYVLAPNITNQLRAVLNDLYAEADIKSQIPRILTGQGGLSSSIRSASMLAQQVSGASKNLKRQIWLIAHNIIKPYIENVFDWYMLNGENEDAKVDADVNIGSIEALVNREFLVGQIQNLIQYLAPYASNGLVKPEVIQQLLFTLMSETGISEDTNNTEILDELQGIVNDVSNSTGIRPASGEVQLDGRSNFQPIDSGSLR